MTSYAERTVEETIYYTAYKFTSGLSDVDVTIIDLSDGSEELTATSMTEVGSSGVYEYAYTFNTAGDYLVKCDSTSYPMLSAEKYIVIDGPTTPRAILVYKGDSATTYYIAQAYTSGLTDVTYTIIDLSDGSTVTSGTMTEIGSSGIYEVDYTYSSLGDYLVKCDCTSYPLLTEKRYNVIFGPYITVSEFRRITGISSSEASNTSVSNAIHDFIDLINKHTGKSRTDPWSSSDNDYPLVQRCNAFGVAHHLVLQGWNLPPIDKTNAKEISSQWLTQYRREIFDLTGRDPYPDIDEKEGSGGPFDASIQTITPDKASYVQSTTR